MNNNIEEDYCSFEISSKMWKKGARLKSERCFSYSYNHPNGEGWYEDIKTELAIAKPTHALAIKWIRENFGIHIMVDRSPRSKNRFDWFYLIKSGDGFNTRPIFSGYFDRPSEATEAAILYTLTKLI